MTRPRRILALLAAVLCAGALGACGKGEETGPVRHATNEGFYLDVGDLKYQVQISRQLNPNDSEDKAYLQGLDPKQATLAPNQIWFGVFLRVENASNTPILPSHDISILDTQAQVYRPVPLDPNNPYAYRSQVPVPANDLLPLRNTPPAFGPVNGVLLVFKLTNTTLDDRPLELFIHSPGAPKQTGIIDLDV